MRSRGPTLLLLGVLLVGCTGGSDEARPRPDPTTTTLRILGPEEVDASASPYCATWAELRALGAPAVTGDETTDAANRRAHYARVVPLAEELRDAAPAAVRDAVEFALEQARTMAATGSDAPLAGEEAATTTQRLAAYAVEHCAG